jgi:hypothetical protein
MAQTLPPIPCAFADTTAQALTILYHLSRGSSSPLQPYLAQLPGLAPGVPTPRVAMIMYDDAVDELQYGALVQVRRACRCRTGVAVGCAWGGAVGRV